MSRSTRSTGLTRSISSACRPCSAKQTPCPSWVRVRATRSRLTRLSSTTSSSVRSRVTAELLQRPRGESILGDESLEPGRGAFQARRSRPHFQVSRERGDPHGAEARGVRLQRVGGASERIDVSPDERVPHRPDELLGVFEEGCYQLAQ